MEINEAVIQFIGAMGYFFLANSYFNKDKAKLLLVQIVSNCFLAVHFYLLAGIGGAICDIVCIVSDTVIFLHDKYKLNKKKLVATLLFIFLFSACIAVMLITNSQFTYKELFPIIATCFIIGSLLSDNKNVIRIVGLVAAICWLIYGIIYYSFASIVFEIIIIVATILSYIREKNIKE
jgi:hypothetical protein